VPLYRTPFRGADRNVVVGAMDGIPLIAR
jgi:hypothetical protein